VSDYCSGTSHFDCSLSHTDQAEIVREVKVTSGHQQHNDRLLQRMCGRIQQLGYQVNLVPIAV